MKDLFSDSSAPQPAEAKPEATGTPLLITVSGLTGSGKSTLAQSLAAAIPNAVHIDSDRTRKELFGVPVTDRLPPEAYTRESTQKLVEETDRRIKAWLAEGRVVVQSVLLTRPATRARQEALAAEAGAPFQGLWLQADFRTMFDRVAQRTNDASDARTDMVEKQAATDIGEMTWTVINASQDRAAVLQDALAILAPRLATPVVSPQAKPAQPPAL